MVLAAIINTAMEAIAKRKKVIMRAALIMLNAKVQIVILALVRILQVVVVAIVLPNVVHVIWRLVAILIKGVFMTI